MTEPRHYHGWATDAVEGLRWLVAVDDWAFGGDRAPLAGRDPDVIDVAHVRWAAVTAVTAIDLCAVELAVEHNWHNVLSERAPTFHQVKKQLRAGECTDVPAAVQSWIDAVDRDEEYELLRQRARDPLTHRLLVRTAHIRMSAPKGHDDRTNFELVRGGPVSERPDARALVLLALVVAERHVRQFPKNI